MAQFPVFNGQFKRHVSMQHAKNEYFPFNVQLFFLRKKVLRYFFLNKLKNQNRIFRNSLFEGV